MKTAFLIEVPDPAYHYAKFSGNGRFSLVDDPNKATHYASAEPDEGSEHAEQLQTVRDAHPGAFMSKHMWHAKETP